MDRLRRGDARVGRSVPGELGWVLSDPTNNLEGCDRHVRVAVGARLC